MASATVHSLTAKERELVDQTQAGHLRTLDEDALADLLARVRRVRDKHVSLYREERRERIATKGARGVAAQPARNAAKAELFEDALARVSAALAKAARASAAELKAERLAAARAAKSSGPAPAATAPASTERPSSNTRARAPKPVEKKTQAATRATGARRQAKRDSR